MKTVGSSVVKRKKDESNIDLTPMLDVVFILLIFFVVTASFLKEQAIDARGQDPNANPPPPPPDAPQNILIEIDNNNVIFFNRERVDISNLRARVAAHRAENPAASVMVRPQPNSLADTLVSAMNSARAAGATSITIAE